MSFQKVAILVSLITLALVLTVSAKTDCDEAAARFVEDYNAESGDRYVKELDKVTGCWTVADDLHMSLIMKTGHGYYKACLNVVAKKSNLEIVSWGTCK